MKHFAPRLTALFFAGATAAILVPAGIAQKPAPAPATPVLKGFPFTNESLTYTVNWPSGLNLGEGHLSATSDSSGWRFEFALDAGIPGYAVRDTYRGTADTNLCGGSFSKDTSHGTRKHTETTVIDQSAGTATRHSNTVDSHTSAMPLCVRDALTYLFYVRRELGQGRVAPAQEILFGATYNASVVYTGAETITVNDKKILADRLVCHIKGLASDIQFDAYFDRDPARTPVAIRVPLPVGKFSLELVR